MESDQGPWDRGEGEGVPPALRRISPADLGLVLPATPATTSAPRSSPPLRRQPIERPSGGAAGDPSCPQCHGAGWLVADARYDDPAFGQLRRCACLDATQLAARQARAAHYLAQVAQDLGAELAGCDLDGFDRQRALTPLTWWDARLPPDGSPRPQKTYSVAEQRLALGRACGIARGYGGAESLYLWGPTGSGKSHLAAAILNAQAGQGVAGCYRSLPAMLRLLRQGFEDGTSDSRLEALIAVPLLVLDDLGTEKSSEWGDQVFFDLLNTRIAARRATILTSNHPPEAAHHDSRIVSRIWGAFTILPLILSDFRVLRAQQRSA